MEQNLARHALLRHDHPLPGLGHQRPVVRASPRPLVLVRRLVHEATAMYLQSVSAETALRPVLVRRSLIVQLQRSRPSSRSFPRRGPSFGCLSQVRFHEHCARARFLLEKPTNV